MNKEVIDMISCPYCEQQWITTHELTCNECDPKFRADMAFADLMETLDSLKKITYFNKGRMKLLDKAITELCFIKNKFENAQK